MRTKHHVNVHAGANQFLAQHEQRGRTHAAGNQQRTLAAGRSTPTAANRADKLGAAYPRLKCGQMFCAEANRLIQHVKLSSLRIGRVNGKRTAQHMAFHARDFHMHELTGFNRRGNSRRGKRHEIQVRANAFVLQNAHPLVHKRHGAPSLVVGRTAAVTQLQGIVSFQQLNGEKAIGHTQTESLRYHKGARKTQKKGCMCASTCTPER